MGFLDDIKGIFQERTVVGLGYATVSGLASGTLGALLERWTKSKWVEYIGDIFGGGIMAWVADKLGHPEWKGYAIFGSVFPPVWEVVTEKISPEQLADKVSASLGLTWRQAAESAYAPPVVIPAEVPPAPSPVEVSPAPAPAVEERRGF